jgi:cell division transport system permease protein
MEAFLADQLSRTETDTLLTAIGRVSGVDSVRYVSKEEAAAIFREEFGEDIYKVLDFNPLPASAKVFLEDGFKNAKEAERIYGEIAALRGVEDVIYRKTLLEMLDKRARTFLWVALGIGIFITISSIFLVANTIRLAIYAKRKIIQTMKLIGATRRFIRIPFILEGLIQGSAGGLAAAAVVFAIFNYLENWVSVQLFDFVKVEPWYYGAIIIAGCILGFLGSVISIRRFIGESVVA